MFGTSHSPICRFNCFDVRAADSASLARSSGESLGIGDVLRGRRARIAALSEYCPHGHPHRRRARWDRDRGATSTALRRIRAALLLLEEGRKFDVILRDRLMPT